MYINHTYIHTHALVHTHHGMYIPTYIPTDIPTYITGTKVTTVVAFATPLNANDLKIAKKEYVKNLATAAGIPAKSIFVVAKQGADGKVTFDATIKHPAGVPTLRLNAGVVSSKFAVKITNLNGNLKQKKKPE